MNTKTPIDNSFKNITLKNVRRICFPAVKFNSTKVADPGTGIETEQLKLDKVEGLTFILKDNLGSTFEHTTPVTQALFKFVYDNKLWVASNSIFELDFNESGEAYAIRSAGIHDDMAYISDYPVDLDSKESTMNRFNFDTNKQKLEAVENPTTGEIANLIVIQKSADNKTLPITIFKADTISDENETSILSQVNERTLKSLNKLDVFTNPNAIIIDKRNDIIYIKLN